MLTYADVCWRILTYTDELAVHSAQVDRHHRTLCTAAVVGRCHPVTPVCSGVSRVKGSGARHRFTGWETETVGVMTAEDRVACG
jgi:hypothetical protein